MAESTSVAVRRDGTILIKDGTTPTPNSYTVAYENGDFSYTEEKSDRVVIRDRGTIVGLRRADDPVLSFSFTVHFRELTNASSDSIIDFIMKTGNASSNVSAGGNGFEQYLVDIDFDVDKRCGDSSKLKKLTGFKPEINLNEGLIKTLKYIKENEKI